MRRILSFLAAAALMAACNPATETRATASRPLAEGLVVHEWGTFTSMKGSDGRILEGLHHEEESLPYFVHRLSGVPDPKGINPIHVTGVTQKLETPVVYFYDDSDFPTEKVRFEVGFPQGVVSEWYPNAREFYPELGRTDVLKGGWMKWEVDLLDGDPDLPAVAEDDIWAPSRRVSSRAIRSEGQLERFIFYRGLASFETQLGVAAGADDRISVHNGSPQPIAKAFLLRVTEAEAGLVDLGSVGPGEYINSVALPSLEPIDAYKAAAMDTVADALVASGLFADEARAMVETWEHSYFHSPGVRVLYVVPRAWTDALLPVRITPEPAQLVRTMVGRIEILTQSEEQSLVARVQRAAADNEPGYYVINELGRFAEAKLRRVHDLVGGQHCADLVEQARLTP